MNSINWLKSIETRIKNLNCLWLALFFSLLFVGCGDDSSPTGTESYTEAAESKQFVWNAMNYWYYWQGETPELQDSYFSNEQEFHDYLRDFNDAESVFNELVYQQEDDFSFFIEDYEEFQQSQQGIFQSFGYQFGLVRISNNSSEILGYVQYTVPDSPAEQNGLNRGDIFTQVDGTQLTTQNYQDLLQGKTSYDLTLAEIEDSTISETGDTVTLQAVTLQEDPIYLSSVIEEGSTQIGYLVYNAFQRNSHQNLNDTFGDFIAEGVDELVVDLRYNGGGAGITSQLLAGMISGIQDSSEFATYSYNNKRSSDWNRSVPIISEVPIFENGEQVSEESMNQLSLDRVYFLVDFGTASASELLINGLQPYMDVVLIGGQTVGKDEGSYTLYDAPEPYLDEENANPDHKMAIQPIVLKLVNQNGAGYPNGFTPEPANTVNEVAYLDSLPPLGSESDPLLARALELITGSPVAKGVAPKSTAFSPGELMMDSRDLSPYKKQLFLDPHPSQK